MRALAITCLFVAACGGDDVHHLGDAPPAPDASIDAATSGPVAAGRIVYEMLESQLQL